MFLSEVCTFSSSAKKYYSQNLCSCSTDSFLAYFVIYTAEISHFKYIFFNDLSVIISLANLGILNHMYASPSPSADIQLLQL